MAYPDDLSLRDAVIALYGEVWPHVPPGIAWAAERGADWFAVSTPFVERHRDRVVAHVGVIRIALAYRGRPLDVAAIHAVCVHPDRRGRGLARRAMERALAWIDRRSIPTTILWSEKSDFYARFGFRPRMESYFLTEAPEPRDERHRRLDLSLAADCDALRRSLAERRPVSNALAIADPGWHFLIDMGLWADCRRYCVVLERSGAIAVGQAIGEALHLYDIVGATMPTCGELVGALAPEARTIVAHFTPDRLDLPFRPQASDDEDRLHVRGAALPGTSDPDGGVQPFAISPLGRT